jgi:predicted Zn-dependent peptidase
MGNEDVLIALMEAEANGHTFMHPADRLAAVRAALETITIEETNAVARELCEHLSHLSAEAGVIPAAVVACFPQYDRNREQFSITDQDVADVISAALEQPLEAMANLLVPDTLLSEETIRNKMKGAVPTWIAIEPRTTTGVVQRTLSNGLRVNLHSLKTEPQKANVRVYVPGGRLRETSPGAITLGCRTMQEGGAFSGATREEVELFCIDHQVMVDIIAQEDSIVFDFQTVTSMGPGGKVSGLEAVMQVAHIILADFLWEDDAFERAKQGLHEQYDSVVKGLETACVERITSSIAAGDRRYTTPTHLDIEALSLDECRSAVLAQLRPDNVEVSISGDVSMAVMEKLSLAYLGTVPPSKLPATPPANDSLEARVLGKTQQIGVFLPDNDERAMGYLAGRCANAWGVYADGSSVADAITAVGKDGKREPVEARRQHPLFGALLQQVVQEVANRRLFSVVREERRLTYDASFALQGKDGVLGGWYLVSVTTSPAQALEAVRACKEALRSLKGPFGVMGDSVQSAKRSLLNRFRTEMLTNKFWVEQMSGTQVDGSPLKTLRCLTDLESVLASITIQDAQLLVERLGFTDDDLTACVGIASATPPDVMGPPTL